METITILAIICSCLSVAVLVLVTFLFCTLCNKEKEEKTNCYSCRNVDFDIERIDNLCRMIDNKMGKIIKDIEKEYTNDSRKRNTERN